MSESDSLDAERIFAVLEAHRVEYVVVGGIAVQVHGHVGMTNDIDVVPAPTPANLGDFCETLESGSTEPNLRVSF